MSTENAAPAYPFAAVCPFQQAPELARLRRDAPVARVRLPGGATGFLVSGHEQVRAVLGDDRFSRRPVRERAADPGAAFDFGLFIADPRDHARWRRVTQQVFTARQAEALRPAVGRIAGELLDGCPVAPAPVDLIGRYCFQLPLRVLFLLFDVPADLRPAFEAWARALRGSGASMTAFATAMSGLHTAALTLVERRRARPGDDAVSRLITAAGTGFRDRDLASTVLLTTVAGFETVATQLGNGLLALFQHPAELARLRRGEIGIAATVEEILRYAQAGTGFAGMLHATTDVVLDGVPIPAGSPVFASTEAAGRDERRVPGPERFDPGRGAAGEHLAFGAGAHYCLGAPLARVELQEGLGRLLHRFPRLALVPAVADVAITGNRFSRLPAALPVTLRGPAAL
ncbi:cytochrome P450 [Actinoplanes sp. NPDC051494]|uniref:cytochrome P450 n=1 Tax=Actinoplanes sp. NPDC051494 TaxID=3363907 RepID=UPI003790F935